MREIASSLLFDTAGRFLFQQRDNIAGITEPGKIGLFGGHREGNETFLECIAREVSEEIGIHLPLERFQPLTVYEDIDLEIGGPIRAEFFVARNISLAQIRVTEGCLVVANAEKIPRLGGRFHSLCAIGVESLRYRYLTIPCWLVATTRNQCRALRSAIMVLPTLFPI